ncbi:hypothetical protein DERF_004292 [Dermatophagoides farinae]|uniref:Uncharacterized protein n=1 Tax=Dermatophagoides farinae TaxID=6954 RepID=A0A922I4I0_DERFA|nr:hypothetical protein DERF_004292 [Dermatophagoides farinae]
MMEANERFIRLNTFHFSGSCYHHRFRWCKCLSTGIRLTGLNQQKKLTETYQVLVEKKVKKQNKTIISMKNGVLYQFYNNNHIGMFH